MKRSRIPIQFLFSLLWLGMLLLPWPARATEADVAAEEVANLIAGDIAADSGKSADNYRAYARRLVTTLSQLSPEARVRVLESHASRLGLSDTTAPGGSPGGNPDGSTNTPANDPAVDGPLVDSINQAPPLSNSELRDLLVDASPLSSAVMTAMIDRAPVLASSDAKHVLLQNVPLPAEIYDRVVNLTTMLTTSDRAAVMDAQTAAAGSTSPPAP